MNTKFELTSETIVYGGKTLYRIKALISLKCGFLSIEAGSLGGFIEEELNLSTVDNSWVLNNSKLLNNSKVLNNSWV